MLNDQLIDGILKYPSLPPYIPLSSQTRQKILWTFAINAKREIKKPALIKYR
jgi:hypothetical protein